MVFPTNVGEIAETKNGGMFHFHQFEAQGQDGKLKVMDTVMMFFPLLIGSLLGDEAGVHIEKQPVGSTDVPPVVGQSFNEEMRFHFKASFGAGKFRPDAFSQRIPQGLGARTWKKDRCHWLVGRSAVWMDLLEVHVGVAADMSAGDHHHDEPNQVPSIVSGQKLGPTIC